MTLKAEYLRHHIDALLHLSRNAKDPAVSAKPQEIADEFNILVSVADITGLAGRVGEPMTTANVIVVQNTNRELLESLNQLLRNAAR
jgi:hypothetical protein